MSENRDLIEAIDKSDMDQDVKDFLKDAVTESIRSLREKGSIAELVAKHDKGEE